MPRWANAMTDERVRELAVEVRAGRTVAEVARTNGVQPQALSFRLHALRLLAPGHSKKSRGQLIYRATCQCGVQIEASQVGDASDSAWLLWTRKARAHARLVHDISPREDADWAQGAWLLWGERVTCSLDAPAVVPYKRPE